MTYKCSRNDNIKLLINKGCYLAVTRESVSYTHLDVYKRQVVDHVTLLLFAFYKFFLRLLDI